MVLRGLFRFLGALRGRRPFHPQGSTYEAAVEPAPDGGAVESLRERRGAVVRFSRGAGLPDGAPDFLGIAIRVLDAYGDGRHQDFLLSSCLPGTGGKFVLRPARTFFGTTFTSLFPYRLGRVRVVFGARIETSALGDDAPALAALERTAAAGLRLELLVARLADDWRVAARVGLGRKLTDEEAARVRFDPWNCGGSLRPSGFLNRLRRPAYAGARRGAPRAP